MRIATYNVHSCIGRDGRCDPARIAAVIAEMNPDVVCLQELDVERARTASLDQAAELARILEMDFHFNATIDEVSGRYGDAILSKLPFEMVVARSLPPVRHPFPRERRGAIWVEVVEEGCPWQIINTHFGLGNGERRSQAHALVEEWIKPALEQPPVVLCGDLNSRPSSAVHTIIGASLDDVFSPPPMQHPRTFSTRWPLVCLDYLFVSASVRVEHAAAWKSPLAAVASDHFPVLAEITAP